MKHKRQKLPLKYFEIPKYQVQQLKTLQRNQKLVGSESTLRQQRISAHLASGVGTSRIPKPIFLPLFVF